MQVQYNITLFCEILLIAGISEKQPTLRQLLDYKNQIGRKWYDLGKILLGERIEIVKKGYPPDKWCSQMLRAWVEGKSHTWGRFIDSLNEVGRKDVAKEIQQKLQGVNICLCVHTYIHTYV